MSQAGVGTVKGAHTDDSLQAAETDLKVFLLGALRASKEPLTNFKTLIERFANCTSSEDLFESIRNIYADADRDQE